MKIILSFFVVLLSGSAFASNYVKCGKQVNFETMEVKGYELEMSSENDDYSGIVGENWSLKLGSEDSEWIEDKKNITATTAENGEVTIIIRGAKTPIGYVGTRYVLSSMYDEEPKLEKYSLGGGIVGPMKLGTYQCASAND